MKTTDRLLLESLVKQLSKDFKISQLQKDLPWVVALRKAKKHIKSETLYE